MCSSAIRIFMASTENSVSNQQSKKEFLCTYDDCLKQFSSLTHLNRHEASYHINKTYRCEECSATFKTQYAQKRHMDNKHLNKKLKKYKCDYCEEDFNKKTWLNSHIFKHTGVKPYACIFENCDARFIVPSKLRRHMKVHEGYTCPKENCDKKFSKWTEVRKHLKVVHPKVYKCPECEQEFSRLNNLKSHLVIHSTDRLVFLCPREGCHRFYSKKYNLDNHISEYHEKRPFNCTFGKCPRAFKSQEELDAHVSIHNPSGRLKKKKKKNKPKPSLAEVLAGLAPKKWQVDLLNDASKSTDAKPSAESTSDSPCIQDNSEPESENTADTLEIMLIEQDSSCIDENCDKVSPLIKEGEQNNNNLNLNIIDSDNDCCIENDDIQTLLNLVEKRKDFEAASAAQKTNCISIKV